MQFQITIQKDTFAKLGWIICDGDLSLLRAAQPLKSFLRDEANLKSLQTTTISGNYGQVDLLDSKCPLYEWAQVWMKRLEKNVKTILQNLSVKQELIDGGGLQHLKLLSAPPGTGGQAAHRDGYSKDALVVAYYLTDHDTTHFSSVEYPSTRIDSMTRDQKRGMTSEYWTHFTVQRAKKGQLSLFYEDVVHKGPPNSTSTTRHVIFSVWTFRNMVHNDSVQYFHWDWIAELYGGGSHVHKDCLRVYKKFAPWNHTRRKKIRRRLQRVCAYPAKASFAEQLRRINKN